MHESWFVLLFGPKGWSGLLLQGALVTFALALSTVPLGFSAGLLVALMKVARSRFLRGFANAYTTFFRGIPDVLSLLIVYYGLQGLIDVVTRNIGLPHLDLSAFLAGVLSLSVVAAAYSSEVWVAALGSVPPSQSEAGRSLGLNERVIFLKIVLPQMMRVAVPGLSNIWTIMLKDTSLVSILAVLDLLRAAQIASQNTTRPLLFYSVAAAVYLIITILGGFVQARFEKRLARGQA
jgi:polar amino acid transport system permease protein